MRKCFYLIFSMLGLLTYTSTILAETASTTFTVSATVTNNCSVTANNLSFGNYDVLTGGAVDSSATISVVCTSGTSYNVGLNTGLGSGATVSSRKMTRISGGSDTLNYSLYQDASHSTVWGNTVGTDTETGTGTGSAQLLTVYGRLFASQNVPAASYQDTITVTVTF